MEEFNDSPSVERNPMIRKLWSGKTAIVLALAAVLLPACTNQLESSRGEAPGRNVTPQEVTDNTQELIGKSVTIRSEPIDKIAPSTFTVNDEQLFGSESILVVNASGETFVLPTEAGEEVQVTGEVRQFVLADIERDYNLGLDPDLYVEYENRPAIIAESMALAPEPGEITDNPQQYYGKRIAVSGEVEDIRSPIAFTLDDEQLLGAEDLLVLYPRTEATVDDDAELAVTGVLRSFVLSDIERDYDLTWDLDTQRQLEVEYSNKPVLIADDVYPLENQ